MEMFEDALSKFANIPIDHLKNKRDDDPFFAVDEYVITMGDIRQAKRVLGLPVSEYVKDTSPKTEFPRLGSYQENC